MEHATRNANLNTRRDKLNKLRPYIFVIAVLLLIIPILTIACSKTEAPTTPSTPSTPSEPAKPAPEPIELSLASMHPPMSLPSQAVERWAEKIKQDSNGLLTIRHFPGSQLIPGPDMRIGIKDGVADLGNSFIYKPEPGFEVGVNLTQLTIATNVADDNALFNDLWNEFPEVMESQWTDFKVIFMVSSLPTFLYTTEKAVRKMDDIKGLEIRVPNAILTALIKNLGGTPVSMSTPDWVTSLDKGTTDGGATITAFIYDFQVGPKFKYATKYAMGSSTNFLIMNMDSWNKLSPELQKVIDDSREWAAQDTIDMWTQVETETVQYARDSGIEFIDLPDDEYAKWNAAAMPVYDQMAADMDAAGYPGTEIVKFCLERSDYYRTK
jgi:TRAP-type C4-dicarboxylate transport system substrate-binding protein